MNEEQIARICHEVNRAYCKALGDNSQVSWEQAESWQRISAITGVVVSIQNDLTPEETHNAWMISKLNEGWIYGLIKDPDKKEHPCLVPFELLPIEQKAKDYIFNTLVKLLKDL